MRDLAFRFPATALAGLVAWTAVGLELWTGPVVATSNAVDLPADAVVRLLHALFIVIFAISLAKPRRRGLRLGLASVLAGMTLAMVGLYRYNSAAALLIIPMLEFAGLLGARSLTLVYIVVNLALAGIVIAFRDMDAPYTYVGLHASLQLLAILLVRSALRTERAREALASTNAELLATRGMLGEIARCQERLHLSRELHDVAGHKLTALRLNLAALVHNRNLDMDETLGLCNRLVEDLLDDLRSVAHQLRLHDGLDLRTTLERMAAPFPRPRVILEIDGDTRVSSLEQAEVLLRAFQEGLTNAARHGGAEHLWANLYREGNQVVLDMRDDGTTGQRGLEGQGLAGMRERLQAVGGNLEFGVLEDGGFHLRGCVPQ